MTEPKTKVRMITGRFRGMVFEKPLSEAENLYDTGQAIWAEEKAVQRPAETPESPDFSGMTKEDLVTLAEERGLDVAREDGEDGVPLKSDYIRALGG